MYGTAAYLTPNTSVPPGEVEPHHSLQQRKQQEQQYMTARAATILLLTKKYVLCMYMFCSAHAVQLSTPYGAAACLVPAKELLHYQCYLQCISYFVCFGEQAPRNGSHRRQQLQPTLSMTQKCRMQHLTRPLAGKRLAHTNTQPTQQLCKPHIVSNNIKPIHEVCSTGCQRCTPETHKPCHLHLAAGQQT
jgi:hypothetical protein